MKAVRSFKGSTNSPLDSSRFVDGFTNTKKRGIGELTSLETTSKDLKPGNGNGNGNDSETNDNDKNNKNNNNDLDTKWWQSESSSVGDKRRKSMEVLLRAAMAEEEEKEEAERSLMTPCVSHGIASVIGRRRVMEDAVAVAIGEIDSYDFFAVYDGHGGARVANACRERMHGIVAEEMMIASGRGKEGGEVMVDWHKVMAVSFEKMDAEVGSVGRYGGVCEGWVNTVGSTAVVVMVGKEVVVAANCGDSRAVLCRGGVAVPLSRDHKPDRPDEKERVEAAGGRVVNWNSSRVLGVLATSRSIGMWR